MSIHFINGQMNVALGLTALSRVTSTSVLCYKKIVGHRSNFADSLIRQQSGDQWNVGDRPLLRLSYFFFSSPLSEADRCLPAEHHIFTMLDRRVHVSDARVKEA